MTMSITMIQTRMGESGSLLTAGNTYSVSDAFGLAMIGAGYATDTNNVRRQALNDAGTITSYTAAQLTALAAAGGLTPYATYVAGAAGVPLWAGSSNSIGSVSSVIVRANLSTANTAAQNSAAITAAVAALALATNGGAGTVQFPEGEFNCDGAITITGFYPQEAGGWNGGILFKGAGINATRLNFASTKAFIIDATGGTTGSTAFVDFADMKITGPGKGVSGSSLLEYAPQSWSCHRPKQDDQACGHQRNQNPARNITRLIA